MAKIDLDRLERLAGGLAVLFYGLLFLALITAIMGSGAGGLLLLLLGAVAHVGRVGLEELAAKRREPGGAPASSADDAERATGVRLKWLPREIRFGAAGSSGGVAGAALGRGGELLGAGTAGVRTSFAALRAEIRERPALPRHEEAGGAELEYDFDDFDEEPGLGDADFAGESDYALEPSLPGDPDFADGPDFAVGAEPLEDPPFDDRAKVRAVPDFGFDEEVAGGVFDGGREFGGEPETIDVPDFFSEPSEPAEPAEPVEPARSPRSRRARADAPTAQERYEARRRARGERVESEPIVVAVEAAEAPQPVRRRKPGGRPDPLQTRRPTRAR